MSTFGERLKIAFENAKNAEIARKMGVSEAAVGNYVAGRIPDAEKLIQIRALTNCDLNWLLTGEGSQTVETSPSDDAFDIEAAIRVNDNPRLVMEQWYDFENLPIPTDFVSSLSLDDWASRSMDTKVRQIKAMRAIYERNRARQKMYASTKSDKS
jgi:transcriptional regulator with XRE-family HTH domain